MFVSHAALFKHQRKLNNSTQHHPTQKAPQIKIKSNLKEKTFKKTVCPFFITFTNISFRTLKKFTFGEQILKIIPKGLKPMNYGKYLRNQRITPRKACI